MEPADPSPPLVLLADDSPANLRLLMEALTPDGLELAVANSGQEALDIAGRLTPDLILLDVLMPGLDGFETCRRLKSDPKTESIPVIFMTSLSEPQYRLAGFDVGAVDYVTKPFERAELLARVRVQVSLRRATRALQQKNAELAQEVQQRTAAQHELTEVVRQLERRTEELHEAHVRLLKLEKRATEVRMAGGFAHEMRNALAGAKLRLAVVQDEGDTSSCILDNNLDALRELVALCGPHLPDATSEQAAKLFRSVLDGDKKASLVLSGVSLDIERALTVTRRIMDYSRQGFESPGAELLDVRRLVDDVVRSIERTLQEGRISVKVELDPSCVLRGTESHFFSILSNLVINARDALLSVDAGERILTVALGRDEEGVVLSVSDNGVGISPENREKIFEPFFSTKGGSGTGLGLSMVERLVALYGGTIHIQSEPRGGTTFRMRFASGGL